MASTRFTVDAPAAGSRLDAFLVRVGHEKSGAAARRAIAAGVVRVDGRKGKKGEHLRQGQTVEIIAGSSEAGAAAPPQAVEHADEDVDTTGDRASGSGPLSVLYEDADIVAILKPAGMPSHRLDKRTLGGSLYPPRDAPAAKARRHNAITAADLLATRFPECARASPDEREGGLGHRLDTGTSGVLLAARHPEAWRRLRTALAADDCEKLYLAEVAGVWPAPGPAGAPGAVWSRDPFVRASARPDSLIIEAPIGRTGRRGARVRVAGGRRPLDARTEITVVERRAHTTLVEARLTRGRAHQVRAHLAYLGFPVVGDRDYGPAGAAPAMDAGAGLAKSEGGATLRLFAAAVTLRHPPVAGTSLRIEAPRPPWARLSSAAPREG